MWLAAGIGLNGRATACPVGAGQRRLYLGAWKHGVSVYGSQRDRGGGFTARHPGLVTSKGTIRPRPADAAGTGDEELLALARAALAP